MKNILVRIHRYPRNWTHATPLKSFKPQGHTISSCFQRWIRTNGRVRHDSRCICTISPDRDSRCPPWTAIPNLRSLSMVPKTKQSKNGQKHSNHHPYRNPDNQSWRFPLHFCVLFHYSLLNPPIHWYNCNNRKSWSMSKPSHFASYN